MPPRFRSRHTYCQGITDDQGRLFLTERVPYRFQSLADNRSHLVQLGDTLQTLAARYFTPLERPAGLWWVIADFQPDPIFDPTITLSPGTLLVIPSIRTLVESIFNEQRRLETDV